MNILGVTHPISWNNAACVIVDGKLVAMVEEERLNRIKHSPRMAPVLAIDYCLEAANLHLADIDFIAVGFDTPLQISQANLKRNDVLSALRWFYLTWQNSKKLPFGKYKDKIVYVNHHLAHAASSYFLSDFSAGSIVSLDGSGGAESGILGLGRGEEIKILHYVSNRESWGTLYEEITELLGFRRHSGEGKVMGLAAYGEPNPAGFPFIRWEEEIPSIDHRAKVQFLKNLDPRQNNDPITTEHKNLAADLQYSLEKAVLQMVEYLHLQSGYRQLCLAGGTALNCSMNGKLLRSPYVDDIFIQPVAHDAGTALGAAIHIYVEKTGQRPEIEFTHAYWGPEYSNHEIEKVLKTQQIQTYKLSQNICRDVARLLTEGRIVGWFQGKLEVGPRALGNRSILADPSNPDMKDLVNKKVKHREPWRPFAPSILEEEAHHYIEGDYKSPFMILAFDTKKGKTSQLISAIHVDNTCRPQHVSKTTNPRYWDLINEFRELTGIPAVLNTSFNDNGEPIVCSPSDALATFFKCGMDYLAIGDYLVWK